MSRGLRSISKIWTVKVNSALKTMEFLGITKIFFATYQTDRVCHPRVKIMDTRNSNLF